MGICASCQYTTEGGNPSWLPPTTKIIYPDGRLGVFRQPIKAGLVLSQNPNCFLCNSDLMHVNSSLPQVSEDEELQLEEIYFLMPLSKSQATLSLQELCSLAIKASAALSHLDKVYSSLNFCNSRTKMVQDSLQQLGNERCCKVPIGFNITGINSLRRQATQKLSSKS